jgi:hypothetical protein
MEFQPGERARQGQIESEWVYGGTDRRRGGLIVASTQANGREAGTMVIRKVGPIFIFGESSGIIEEKDEALQVLERHPHEGAPVKVGFSIRPRFLVIYRVYIFPNECFQGVGRRI